MQSRLHERESLHSAFGSYVDPTLAQRLLAQGDAIFEGEEVDVTVFFADVREFTTFADGLSAELSRAPTQSPLRGCRADRGQRWAAT